jgi:hypothetical protein
VARGDGRVGGEQQRRERLADQVRAPDHDGLGAPELDVVAAQQLHHARRCARAQARPPLGQQARGDRGEAVDVLARVDDLRQRGPVDLRRRRELEQDAGNRGIGVELAQQALDLVVRGVLRQPVVEAGDADLARSALLAADVDGRSGVLADEDGGQPRLGAAAVDPRGDVRAHLLADLPGDRLPVDDLGRHRRGG